MQLLAPFIVQIFKKILRADPKLWQCVSFSPKMVHLSLRRFFCGKTISIVSPTSWSLILRKILRPRVMKWPNCSERGCFFFFWETIYITLTYLNPFHWAQFKKILTADRVMTARHFWAQNGAFAPMKFFSEKTLI